MNSKIFPNDLPPRQPNVNGVVGTFFCSASLIIWIVLCLLMVSYKTNVAKPQPTGDGQRDLGEELSYEADIVLRKSAAFAANSFLAVVGGILGSIFLLIGVVTSGIGLAYPGKTYSIVGLSLGAAALICGIVFVYWRWSVWFG